MRLQRVKEQRPSEAEEEVEEEAEEEVEAAEEVEEAAAAPTSTGAAVAVAGTRQMARHSDGQRDPVAYQFHNLVIFYQKRRKN